jgi:hypothetical protein
MRKFMQIIRDEKGRYWVVTPSNVMRQKKRNYDDADSGLILPKRLESDEQGTRPKSRRG